MARYPLPQAIGLSESTPAGEIPLGHYDSGVNVRDFDERGQRKRVASRAGLLSLGTPCSASSPVTHSFTAKRPVARYEFTEVTTTADATATPTQLAEKWSTDMPTEPLDYGRTTGGVLILLLADGDVWEVRDDGGKTLLFSVEVPVDFTMVPSLAVDDSDNIHVAVTFTRQIDGNASRFYKYTRDEFGVWSLTVESLVEYVVERFWYDSGDIFCALDRPEGVEDGLTYGIGRYGGALTGQLAKTWTQEAPNPVRDISFRGGSIYYTSGSNPNRTVLVPDDPATVDWTPRELTAANERLYWYSSTLRDKNANGYVTGQVVRTVHDARPDASNFATVIDTTVRQLSVPSYLTSGAGEPFRTYPGFTLAEDSSGISAGYELRIDEQVGATTFFPLTHTPEPAHATSLSNTGEAEKTSATDVAAWARALTPGMGESIAPLSSAGARWALTLLVRLENYAQADTTTTPNITVAQTDWKIIWQHGAYCLKYRGDASGADITIAVDIPGTAEVASQTYTGEDNDLYCITFVSNGYGLAGSYLRINGVNVGSSFTLLTAPPSGIASSFGGLSHAGSYLGASSSQMKGGFKECCTWLGTTVTNPHDTGTPLSGDIEEVEGYQCHAYGAQSRLAGGHPYFATPPASAGTPQPGFDFGAAFQQPEGMAVKMDRADGTTRWVHVSDACGNGIAADPDEDSEAVYVGGSPLDVTDAAPARVERIDDAGDTFSSIWTNDLGASFGYEVTWADDKCELYVDGCGEVYLPFTSGRTVPTAALWKLNPATGVARWAFTVPDGPTAVIPGGLFIDDRYKAGACVDQYVYVVCRGGASVKRIELGGRRDTGETRDQITDQIATCKSGVVARRDDGAAAWTELVSDFTPGGRPWSFELFGQHFFGGPEDYRVYDAKRQILREWTPNEGSLIPGRIFIAERWRGRAMVVSEDDRHILYGSAYGDAFDFRTGGAVVTATQAFAGTTAAAGAIPDPVTALVVANDDLMYVGTNRSVWRLTGDPQTGGQLDDVLASEGILGPYAHTRGDSGELYWLTTSLRVLRVGSDGMRDISSDTIEGRLQSIDRDKYRVELSYSTREKGLYLMFFPRSGYEVEVEHLFWSSRTGRWHPVMFSGDIGRALTCAAVLESADAGGWGALWGFADGALRFAHPEALDDDGVPIATRMRLPVAGDGDANQSLITQVELVLADDQSGVRVAGVAGRTGQTGADYGPEKMAVPGRGNLLQIQVAGFNTWVEVIGTGQPWAIDSMAVHAHKWRLG